VDRKFVETIATIPASQRLASGKRLLVEAIPEIPDWVKQRPKQGFVFPFKDWVTGEWRDVFRRIEQESPVPLKNWYRCWCLFALEEFIKRSNIEIPGTTGRGLATNLKHDGYETVAP
jgi:asparagine synthase (glutamine-hydrolysing)